MRFFIICFLCLFEHAVSNEGKEDNMFTACYKNDKECLNNLVRQFIDKITTGIPEHDVESLAVVIIPSLEYSTEGINSSLSNVNITGVRDAKVESVDLDIAEATTEIWLTLNLNIVSDIQLEFTKKTLTGGYEVKANNAQVSTKYGFTIDDQQYFEVLGDETKCLSISDQDITFTYSPDLQEAIDNDPDLSETFAKYNAKRTELVCKIAQGAMIKLIEKFRVVCRLQPANKYIIDI